MRPTDWASIHQKDPRLFDLSETPEAKPEGEERDAFVAALKEGRSFYGHGIEWGTKGAAMAREMLAVTASWMERAGDVSCWSGGKRLSDD